MVSTEVLLALLVGFLAALALALRLMAVLPAAAAVRWGPRKAAGATTSVLVVLGSGGHTMEMLRLLASLSPAYSPRTYVISDTDKMSEEKVLAFEKEHRGDAHQGKDFTIVKIPRSREVRQSWITTILYTAKSLLFCVPLVLRTLPDVVLCNGPGTCVPVCLIAYIPRFLGIKRINIAYVESICRVHTLSLSGKLLYTLSDLFVVQWASLREKYPRALHLGRFM